MFLLILGPTSVWCHFSVLSEEKPGCLGNDAFITVNTPSNAKQEKLKMHTYCFISNPIFSTLIKEP